MQSTMMRMPLSLNHVLERAGTLFPESEIVPRLPDRYDFIAEIPRTSTGKFWKAKLRSRYR
jgi:acyl-coenzyme A synthetase/AMP-(fatty) acid ligase